MTFDYFPPRTKETIAGTMTYLVGPESMVGEIPIEIPGKAEAVMRIGERKGNTTGVLYYPDYALIKEDKLFEELKVKFPEMTRTQFFDIFNGNSQLLSKYNVLFDKGLSNGEIFGTLSLAPGAIAGGGGLLGGLLGAGGHFMFDTPSLPEAVRALGSMGFNVGAATGVIAGIILAIMAIKDKKRDYLLRGKEIIGRYEKAYGIYSNSLSEVEVSNARNYKIGKEGVEKNFGELEALCLSDEEDLALCPGNGVYVIHGDNKLVQEEIIRDLWAVANA